MREAMGSDEYERLSYEASEKAFAQKPERETSREHTLSLFAREEAQRNSILQQVHAALDAYEKASRVHTYSLFAREEAQRNSAITTAMATCSAVLERRIKAIEELGCLSAPGPSSLQASPLHVDSVFDVRLRAIEAQPASLEARIKAIETELETSSARLMAGVQTLEGDILVLQGELVMLQARTCMQGVSGSIFSLRAADLEERSRLRAIEMLVRKESEVAHVLSMAKRAREQGGMADLLTSLGMRVGQSHVTGERQVSNFSLAASSAGAGLHMVSQSKPDRPNAFSM